MADNDIKTPPCVVAFAHNLFTPQERDNGKSQYNATLLFPKTTDISALEEAALGCAVAQWGDKARAMIANGLIKNPFLDGDGKQGLSKTTGERHAGFAGHTFIRVTSGADYKPRVFDRKREVVFEKDGCRSGSRVVAVINPFAWEHKENGKGITFGISLLQVIENAEGDAILGGGSGPDPSKWLEAIEGDDAPPETKGGTGAKGLFS